MQFHVLEELGSMLPPHHPQRSAIIRASKAAWQYFDAMDRLDDFLSEAGRGVLKGSWVNVKVPE